MFDAHDDYYNACSIYPTIPVVGYIPSIIIIIIAIIITIIIISSLHHRCRLSRRMMFLQGDAKGMLIESLQPLLSHELQLDQDANKTSNDLMININHPAIDEVESQQRHPRVSWLLIQFPDPWTKTKHLKRRLVDSTFVQTCSDIISKHSDGELF